MTSAPEPCAGCAHQPLAEPSMTAASDREPLSPASGSLNAERLQRRTRVIGYEAPFLIDKLVDTGAAETREEAVVLFAELKKYLWLFHDSGRPLPMTSARVDAVWHQLVLFTREYAEFCQECFGAFLHHNPTRPDAPHSGEVMADNFDAMYAAQFGPLPSAWRDWEGLSPATRLRRRRGSAQLAVAIENSRALLLRGAEAEVVCRTEPRARPALEHIAQHRSFLVRELPGLRTAEEQLILLRPLVRCWILALAV